MQILQLELSLFSQEMIHLKNSSDCEVSESLMKSAALRWISPPHPSAEALILPALALIHSPNHHYLKAVFLPEVFQCCGGQRIFYSGL